MIYLQLYWEFFKIGLFAVGGGMATLPFLEDLAQRTGWFTSDFLSDMVAISESTPGPIGINMATYVGWNLGGFLGGLVATLGEITPSLIIVTLISRKITEFSAHPLVERGFYGLRPGVTGLIAAAGIGVLQQALVSPVGEAISTNFPFLSTLSFWKTLYFLLVFLAIRRWKKHPIFYIGLSALVGISFQF